MNSHQRRKDRRRWKYEIRLNVYKFSTYCQIYTWAIKTISPYTNHRWREAYGSAGTIYQFDNERDAVLFKLKWSQYENESLY